MGYMTEVHLENVSVVRRRRRVDKAEGKKSIGRSAVKKRTVFIEDCAALRYTTAYTVYAMYSYISRAVSSRRMYSFSIS